MVEKLTSRAGMDQFLLESVINTIPIFIYWKDVNLIYIGCNKHYATINGFEKISDIIGKIDENLPWANYRFEEIQRSDKRVIKNNVPEYNITESWVLPNGNEVIYNTNRIPIRNADGNVVGILTTYEDFTEKIFLERSLKISEERYRLIAENANDLIAIIDETSKIEYRNSIVTKSVLGYTDEEVFGKLALDRIHPEDYSEISELFKKSLKIGEGIAQFRYRHKDGHYLWLESKGKSFKNSEGNKKFLMISRDITDRKIAEQKVKESEAKFRDITELLPDTIFEVNSQSFMTYINPAGLKKFGLTPEDIERGVNAFEFIARHDERNHAIENMKKHLSGIDVGPNEYLFRGKEGTEFYGLVHSQPIYHKDVITGIRGILIDISESKKAQILINEEKKKLEYIMESMIDGLCVNDVDGTIIQVNKPFLEMFGYETPEEMIGNTFLEFVPEMEGKRIKKRFLETLRKKEPIVKDFEMTCKRKEGVEFLAIFNTRNLWNENGKHVGSISVARDITERKKTEQQLKESETKYRHLFNSTPYAIWLVDMKGKIIDCNTTMNQFMSIFKREDLIGKSFREVIKMFISKGDPRFEKLEHTFRERFKLLLKQGYLDPIEFEISRGDGKTFWITLETSFVTVGKESLIQAFIKDITERKETELKIKQSKEELKILNRELEQKVKERTKELEEKNLELMELDRAKDDFISMAAHELKTPLISISGYTDFILMKHEDDLPLDIKDDLKIVQKNIARLQGLMNQLLNVMKLESHRIEIFKEKINVSDIIYRCLHELSYLFKEKDHEVVLNIDNEIILNTDSNLMFQVFSNLISNSVKFTPKGGRIEISAKKGDDKYHFEVKDTGIGLARDKLPRLFKKFETIKQKEDDSFQTGTGLGLYISKGFIEAHGGEMWAISEGEYKGMAIHFTIPY